MDKEKINLDSFKGENPFKVPNGYFEGLTGEIMRQIPLKERGERGQEVVFMDRIRPWLYLAAVFVGLGLFFKAIIGIENVEEATSEQSLLVHSENKHVGTEGFYQSEEEEYLDFLEAQYVDCLLDEELFYVE